MTGWRARLGFLVPPGNPTVEPEMIALAPRGVTVHFSRLVAHGATGSHTGQEERNQTMVAHAAESAGLLAMVKPDVIMFTHTATSYTLGPQKEAELIARLSEQCGTIVETAFASVLEALRECRQHWLGIAFVDGGEQRPDAAANDGVIHGCAP